MKGKNLELAEFRNIIDRIDDEIMENVFERIGLMGDLAEYKKKNNIPVFDPAREREVIARITKKGIEYGLSDEFIKKVYQALIDESKRIQKIIFDEG